MVTPELPCDDDAAGLPEYAEAVAGAISGRTGVVLVAHSLGGFTVPWPLPEWPTPTAFLLCRDDRFLPAAFMRRVVSERLGIVPDEIDGGHMVALTRPRQLADRLEAYAATDATPGDERRA